MITVREYDEIITLAEVAIAHTIVRNTANEYADNMGFKLEGLPAYGMDKVMMHAAIVAICLQRGIDPEELWKYGRRTTETWKELVSRNLIEDWKE